MTWRVVIVLAACGGSAEVPVMPSNQAPTSQQPPDLAKLRSLLRPHDRDAFTQDAIENRACQKGTLGDYIELLYREGTSGPDQHELTGGCGSFPEARSMIDPPADPDYWFCHIDSRTAAGGEPWHYELRIRVRKRDLDLDFDTMACPGTP